MRVKLTGFDIAEKLKAQDRQVKTAVLGQLLRDFRQQSYEGATKRLKSSWLLIEGERGYYIINTAPNSLRRVAGYKGRLRPSEIESLRDWVIAKGITKNRDSAESIAKSIARNIERTGTGRWVSGRNFLGIDAATGDLKPNSVALKAADEIAARMAQVRIR
jgi:hypothetical protein